MNENVKTTDTPVNDNQDTLGILSAMVEKFCLENNISVFVSAAIEKKHADGTTGLDSVIYANGKKDSIKRSISNAMDSNIGVADLIVDVTIEKAKKRLNRLLR